MIKSSDFKIQNKWGEYLNGNIHYNNDAQYLPVIIICHGFKGFKDWGFFPVLADTLAQNNFAAIRFNFSRNGIGEDMMNFTELEKFANNTYGHELNDLKTIIDAVHNKEVGDKIFAPKSIGLVGHSRGGGIALLHTAHDQRIKSLVTLSAISHVARYNEKDKESFEYQGFIEIENKRTGQIMKINRTVFDDIINNAERLDILKNADLIDVPTLIIHGEKDESVPVSEATEIYDRLKASAKHLELIENAGHTFNMTHPPQTVTPEFNHVIRSAVNWFKTYLH